MPSTPRSSTNTRPDPVMRSNTSPRTKQERRDLAEQSLLEAARRLVARRGVDQTSVADVGVAAGYSRGLVNHHFGSKKVLLRRAARESQREIVEIVEGLTGNGLELLVAMVRSYLSWIDRKPDDARAFFAMWGAALPQESDLREVFADFDAGIRRTIEQFVRVGQGDGTIRTDAEPAGVAAAVTGMLRGTGAQLLVAPEGVAVEAACAVCEQFVRRSLAAPGTTAP
ncbi:TetR family transcriptional regulator C-terminal domain-containing protein [Streptomyces sp. NPDC008092]|uniref:TetR/AcrR family transcriptional regulator n=1 Tax=Streptomyces sp. NPDC008092 TaxID=3364808 RepID=UPI0036E1CCA1